MSDCSFSSVLVTGGAGFIGGHLVERVVAEGCKVRVVDDFSSGRQQNLENVLDRIELVRGDIRDATLMKSALKDVEVIFHQAAIPSVPQSIDDPLVTHAVNTQATLDLLHAARDAGVKRFVFASSCAIYGASEEIPKVEAMKPDPLSPYALQKYCAEEYCRLFQDLYGFEAVALRYFNVFGPRQNPESEYAAAIPRFIAACLKGEAPRIYGDGEQTRDFVYVADVVRANWLAATQPDVGGSVLNVASGNQTSLNQLVAEIRDLTGCQAVPIHEEPRLGDVRHSLADLSYTRERLAYEPSVGLRDGLARTMEAMQNSFQGGGLG